MTYGCGSPSGESDSDSRSDTWRSRIDDLYGSTSGNVRADNDQSNIIGKSIWVVAGVNSESRCLVSGTSRVQGIGAYNNEGACSGTSVENISFNISINKW